MKIVVKGMTCESCVKHVREALEALPGVSAVKIDLQTGAASFDDPEGHDVEDVRAAIEDAGYEMIAP